MCWDVAAREDFASVNKSDLLANVNHIARMFEEQQGKARQLYLYRAFHTPGNAICFTSLKELSHVLQTKQFMTFKTQSQELRVAN